MVSSVSANVQAVDFQAASQGAVKEFSPPVSTAPPYSRPVPNPSGFGPRQAEQGGGDYWSFQTTDAGHEIYMRYDDSSWKWQHKMYVQTYHDGETKSYLIDINSINPADATRLEMYVLTVDKYGSGYGSTQPHPAELFEKLDFISKLASPKNPLYKANPASDFSTERLNYVELAAELFQSPKRDTSVFDDKFFAAFALMFGESLFDEPSDSEATRERQQKKEPHDIYGAKNSWVM